MTHQEREKLFAEIQMLKILLDFHIQNKDRILMDEQEFQAYVDTILDRLNEIQSVLGEKK